MSTCNPLPRKEGTRAPREFSLVTKFEPKHLMRIADQGMGDFYFDAAYGLALGVDSRIIPENKIWLAVTSFCLGRGLENYRSRAGLEDLMPSGYPHPVIVQVQGPSRKDTYGNYHREVLYQEATSVLRDYKWERALIGLTLTWAGEEGIPSVYLLPAEKNRWRADNAREHRFKLRYDVSAQRLGFQLQPNGLYATSVQ